MSISDDALPPASSGCDSDYLTADIEEALVRAVREWIGHVAGARGVGRRRAAMIVLAKIAGACASA